MYIFTHILFETEKSTFHLWPLDYYGWRGFFSKSHVVVTEEDIMVKEYKGGYSNGSNSGGGGGDSGNRDNEVKILYGTWDNLKANFKQIDFYQNSIRENNNDKSKVLRVPLTCLIDYCGFRFLCEYELPGKMRNNDSQRK